MKPFIAAEMSANHLGSLERALRIVDAAAAAGADGIKLQTWKPDTMCVSDYRLPKGPWAGRLLSHLYKEAHTPWDWHEAIFKRAREQGLVPFSAPFDCESADFLESLGVDRYKIASFELVDIPLIRHVAAKGKPMIMSTGMASGEDITRAANVAAEILRDWRKITLVVCTSAYPAEASAARLYRLEWLRSGDDRGQSSGLSDHTTGIGVAVAAAALGATYIEKHLTLSRDDGGPDAAFSMEPSEFAQMVIECRNAHDAVFGKAASTGEDITLRRSLWVVADTPEGQPLVLGENVRTARPAFGVPCHTNLENKRASRSLKAGEPLQWEDIA